MSLWPNALRALDVLGIGASVREHAALGGDSGVRRPDGRWLARTRLGPAIIARFGDPLIIVARRRLAGLLRAELPVGAVRHGQTVTGVTAGGPGTLATVWTAASTAEADLVIGADGASSVLRRSLFGSAAAPRYAGCTAWRMIAPAPPAASESFESFESFETWGPGGSRFAVLPLGDGTCYCYATLVTPENTAFDDDLGELRRLFGEWHQPIPDILAGLADAAVLRNDITDLSPLPAQHRGRVALLGDAGHAMTPELG